MLHQYRTETFNSQSVGFYSTVRHTLVKYNLVSYWNNIPDVNHEELKNLLKKPIWSFHWKHDVAMTVNKDTPFSNTILTHIIPLPTYPYKSTNFLDCFNTNKLPRSALSMVLRFWLTPSRTRLCSCAKQTNDLAKHLLFSCSKTRNLMVIYKASLPIALSTILCSTKLHLFLRQIASSKCLLEDFNLLISRFEYPCY